MKKTLCLATLLVLFIGTTQAIKANTPTSERAKARCYVCDSFGRCYLLPC
ncbi:MAG TPA: hypothetical protein VNM66_08140 [Thermodesulfobacteriota bacterium]|nr:hypothetical protein [Thermodesulfobacteriota bacterium]